MKVIYIIVCLGLLVLKGLLAESKDHDKRSDLRWKIGIAEVVITPEKPMRMAGYSGRLTPAEETHQELKAKAVVLEDKHGERAVMVSAEIRNFPKEISDRIRDRLKLKFDMSRDQIILNGTHTHSGPLLYTERNYPNYIFDLSPEEERVVRWYSSKLEDDVVSVVEDAMSSLVAASLYTGSGVARFAVNRRNNPSWQNPHARYELHELSELAGPVDHSVPVIKVEDAAGQVIAILFSYACHPTANPTEKYMWAGDWPGYTQLRLEELYPEATALFFLGAAGDQDPMPRQTDSIAEQYGLELAAAVDRVLKEDMRPLKSRLTTTYSEIDLRFSTPPGYDELVRMVEEWSGRQKNWATFMLDEIEDESFRRSYPYPVQVWKIGDLPLISLGGELVVDYAVAIKRIFGHQTIVFGYSNDVMAYIPSTRILREGGYEGTSSQMARALPSTWAPEIEIMILSEVLRLAEEAGVTQYESSLWEN